MPRLTEGFDITGFPVCSFGPWWDGFQAGFRGQACTPPKGEQEAARYRDGHGWGRVERELYDLRQKARTRPAEQTA